MKWRAATFLAAPFVLFCLAVPARASETGVLRGIYIVSGAFERGWEDGPGVPGVLATRQALETALARSIADIRRLGFNTLILDPGFYAGRSFSYEAYAEIAAEQAAQGRVGILLGLPISCPAAAPQCWENPRERNDAYLAACSDGADQRAFIDRFAARPAVSGFLCAYENFGQPNVTPASLAAIGRLTRYIEDKGKIYFDIPAAGRQSRVENVFSLITPQLNPRLFSTPSAMAAEIGADATRYGGAEINFWHSQTTPENGYPAGASGAEKWHQLQYDALVRLRLRNVTVFDYQKLLAAQDGTIEFYQPRGWLMSLMARIEDPSLVFYDPLESRFASAVMHVAPFGVTYGHDGLDALIGHGVDGGTAEIGRDGGLVVPMAIAAEGGFPLSSIEAGTFSAWVKASWPARSDGAHGLLQTPCFAPDRNCLSLEIAGENIEMILWDGRGARVSEAAPLGDLWRPGEWNYLAATWDRRSGHLALYCDGHLIGTRARRWDAGPALPRDTENYRLVIGNLGARAPDDTHGLDGELDEARLYSRALAAEQIDQLYRSFTRTR
jgi:Concanavalin A-like lectin/glucanases superfamily